MPFSGVLSALAVLVGLCSCGLEEPYGTSQNESSVIEFVARPVGFNNQPIDTKSEANTFENSIYNCFFLLFDNTTGDKLMGPIDLTSSISNNALPTQLVKLDKIGEKNVSAYFIANVPKSLIDGIIGLNRPETVENTQENNQLYLNNAVLDITYDSEGIAGTPSIVLNDGGEPINCIPMLGCQTISLPSSDPLVQIPIKRLFAKVRVNVNLNQADSGEVGTQEPTFHVNKYIINNLPTKVSFKEGKSRSATDANAFVYSESSWISDSDSFTSEYGFDSNELGCNNSDCNLLIENDADQSNGFQFEFYAPEYILLPDPDKLGGISNNISDSDRERLKPTLPKDGTFPIYVSIRGTYVSVFGEDIDMTYDIFLGENQYDNFSLIGNVLYTNNVTIKGTSFVDNRVEMKYAGFQVGFPHSIQMDSHFNVRPLRLKFTDEFISGYEEGIYKDGEIKIEILNTNNQSSWIALERPIASNIPEGNTIYSKGVQGAPYPTKRRYFTTNLISELNNQEVNGEDDPSAGQIITFRTDDVIDNDNSGDTPLNGKIITWVYVDENTTRSTSDIREATIAVTFTMDGSTEGVTKQYLVRQSAIYPIETEYAIDNIINKRSYGLELFEEYTMNYDTDTYYDSDVDVGFHTNVNGIKWGLEGVELSRNTPALSVSEASVTVSANTHSSLKSYLTTGVTILGTKYDLINTIIKPMVQEQMEDKIGDIKSYYDFHTSDDTESGVLSSLLGTDGARDYDGFKMNVEIVHTLLQEYGSLSSAKLNGIILDETPLSAIAYCYNKNKRNDTGEVAILSEDGNSLDITNYKWYAPAIKELEEIMQQAYNNGEWLHSEFQTFGNPAYFYWSCQPAYLNNAIDLNYTANTEWTINGYELIISWTGVKNETWSEKLTGQYIADASGAYLQDDVGRARSTQYNPSAESTVESYSNHVSKIMNINGTFSKNPHTETGQILLSASKTDVLNNIVSTKWWSATADYFISLSSYLNGANWNASGVIDTNNTPDRGDGNQSRDTFNRVRCVYKDHNYKKATRSEVTGWESAFGQKGYKTELSTR